VTTSPTRVALAEDDVVLREGTASLLERSGLEVVGQAAGDATQLNALVRKHRSEWGQIAAAGQTSYVSHDEALRRLGLAK
jgi:DNA-binding NarL/FixJ family response regulator